ncbi:MAG: isopentenyl-diphosphate delta-isomerase, partial [Lachnospiraceae bacterium]|nr:isopentenyl-diphosphate delta-isomerase [Lachnospiraceae bacterium]
ALARIVRLAALDIIDGRRTFCEVLDRIDERLEKDGLEALCGGMPACGYAEPRRQEIAAALNRCRFLGITRK